MRLASLHPAEQNPVADSDEVLVQRVAGGAVDQLEELVRRYQTGLVRYLNRIAGSDALAEDIHQQTWLKVLENAGRFEAVANPGGFKAWLFRIATNLTHDHWRSHTREQTAHLGMRVVVAERRPAPAEDAMECSEESHKLKWAIEQLPETQKQVLMMRFYGEMKYADIAQAVGCPLNTALGRMYKAIHKLRELMEKPR